MPWYGNHVQNNKLTGYFCRHSYWLLYINLKYDKECEWREFCYWMNEHGHACHVFGLQMLFSNMYSNSPHWNPNLKQFFSKSCYHTWGNSKLQTCKEVRTQERFLFFSIQPKTLFFAEFFFSYFRIGPWSCHYPDGIWQSQEASIFT